MSKIFFFYALIAISISSPLANAKSSKSTKKCSSKNLEILWEKSGSLLNIAGQADVEITKIFMNQNYAKSNIEEVRSQIFEIQKENATKSAPVISAIEALLEKHPECDKKNIFTNKK